MNYQKSLSIRQIPEQFLSVVGGIPKAAKNSQKKVSGRTFKIGSESAL
jgi:hypothetical protein